MQCKCESKKLIDKKRIRIDECNISMRTLNALEGLRFEYLDEIAEKTAEELVQFRNFGNHSLRLTRKLLAFYGMSLKGDFLANSEEEKRLIQDMPKTILELKWSLMEIEKRVKCITDQLDQLHANMQPLDR